MTQIERNIIFLIVIKIKQNPNNVAQEITILRFN